MTKKQKTAYQREWYAKNKAKKTNGTPTNSLIEVIKAYQILHSATNDGELKMQLTKSLIGIVSKI